MQLIYVKSCSQRFIGLIVMRGVLGVDKRSVSNGSGVTPGAATLAEWLFIAAK